MDPIDDLVAALVLTPYGLTPEDLPPEPEIQPGQWFVRSEPPREPAVILFENVRR